MATTMIQVDPREIDALHVRAGWAVGAMGPTKRVARALGVSERAVQAWRAGERPSALARCGEMFRKLTAAGMSPFAGLAFLEAECAGAMMQMSDDALVERFWTLMDEETERQGRLDATQVGFARTGDLRAIEDEAGEHGASLSELRYVARELRRRQIDPRTHKPSRVRVGRAS